MRKAYLVLADGTVYEGRGFGAERDAIGTLVFNTGVVGYIELLTSPVCAGQIVLQTFPLIGNYGVIEEDFRGKPLVHGYVVREWCDTPSNFRSQYNVDKFLRDNGIPGICGLDTRALTRKIRECGEMNAMICSRVPADLGEIQSYRFDGASACEECEKRVHPAAGEAKMRAALIDYGAAGGIIDALTARGCEVTQFPASVSAEEILSGNFDGLVLSDGPGDPEADPARIHRLRALLGRLPIFGAGLGHLLLAVAAGGKTGRMKHGHRGGNQPVKDVQGTRTYITGQNHGHAVLAETVPGVSLRYVNLNDSGCEGLDYPALNAFSVQFVPEKGSRPQDTTFLYDRFISMMGGDDACR